MVKQLVIRKISGALSEYFIGVNEKTLELALLSGVCTLNNLKLRTDLVQKYFNFKVKSVFIGTVTIKYSLLTLLYKPIEIYANDIKITIDKNIEFSKEDFIFQKMKFLEAETEKIGKPKQMGGILVQLFEKAIIKLKDIELKFLTSEPESPKEEFFNLRIGDVNTTIVDENWHENIEFENADLYFKIFEVNKFIVEFGDHKIIKPCDLKCRIVVRKRNFNIDQPDINIDFLIPKVNATFDAYTYKTIIDCINVSNFYRTMKNTIKKNLKLFDVYSNKELSNRKKFKTIMNDVKSRDACEDQDVVEKRAVLYKSLYHKFTTKIITEEELLTLNKMEEEGDVNVIIKLRTVVLKEQELQPRRKFFFWTQNITEEEKKEIIDNLEIDEQISTAMSVQLTLKVDTFNICLTSKNNEYSLSSETFFFKQNTQTKITNCFLKHLSIYRNQEFIFKSYAGENFALLDIKNNHLSLSFNRVNLQRFYLLKVIFQIFLKYPIKQHHNSKFTLQNNIIGDDFTFQIDTSAICYFLYDKLTTINLKPCEITGDLNKFTVKMGKIYTKSADCKTRSYFLNNFECTTRIIRNNELTKWDISIPEIIFDISFILSNIEGLKSEISNFKGIRTESQTESNHLLSLKVKRLFSCHQSVDIKDVIFDIQGNNVSLLFNKIEYHNMKCLNLLFELNEKILMKNADLVLNLDKMNVANIKKEINNILHKFKSFTMNEPEKIQKNEIEPDDNATKDTDHNTNDSNTNNNINTNKNNSFEIENITLILIDESNTYKMCFQRFKGLTATNIHIIANKTVLHIESVTMNKNTIIFDNITAERRYCTFDTIYYLLRKLNNVGILPIEDNKREKRLEIILRNINLKDHNITTHNRMNIMCPDLNSILDVDNLTLKGNFELISKIKTCFLSLPVELMYKENKVECNVCLIGKVDTEFLKTIVYSLNEIIELVLVIIENVLPRQQSEQKYMRLVADARVDIFNYTNNEFLLALNCKSKVNGRLCIPFKHTEFERNHEIYNYETKSVRHTSHASIYDHMSAKIFACYHTFDVECSQIIAFDKYGDVSAYIKNFTLNLWKHEYGMHVDFNIDFIFMHMKFYKFLMLRNDFMPINIRYNIPLASTEITFYGLIKELIYKNISIGNITLSNEKINFNVENYLPTEDYMNKYSMKLRNLFDIAVGTMEWLQEEKVDPDLQFIIEASSSDEEDIISKCMLSNISDEANNMKIMYNEDIIIQDVASLYIQKKDGEKSCPIDESETPPDHSTTDSLKPNQPFNGQMSNKCNNYKAPTIVDAEILKKIESLIYTDFGNSTFTKQYFKGKNIFIITMISQPDRMCTNIEVNDIDITDGLICIDINEHVKQFLADQEIFNTNSVFSLRKPNVFFAEFRNIKATFYKKYILNFEYMNATNNDINDLSIFKGMFLAQVTSLSNLILEKYFFNFIYQNRHLEISGKEHLRAILTKCLIMENNTLKVSLHNYTETVFNVSVSNTRLNKDEINEFEMTEQNDINAVQFFNDLSIKVFNTELLTATRTFKHEDLIYVVDIKTMDGLTTIKIFYNVIFKNYTGFKLSLYNGDDEVSKNDYLSTLTLEPFCDGTFARVDKIRYYTRVYVNEWKESPDIIQICEGSDIGKKESLDLIEKRGLLFFDGDCMAFIHCDIIEVQEAGHKTFYIIFYVPMYLNNCTNIPFTFILQNKTHGFTKRITVSESGKTEGLNHIYSEDKIIDPEYEIINTDQSINHEKNIGPSQDIIPEESFNPDESINSGDIEKLNIDNSIKVNNINNPENHVEGINVEGINVEDLSIKYNKTGEKNIAGAKSAQADENINAFNCRKSFLSIHYMNINNEVNLIYKGKLNTDRVINICRPGDTNSTRKGVDLMINLGQERKYGVSYNIKERALHNKKYYPNITEIIIYPYYIVNNNLNQTLLIGNTRIKAGVTHLNLVEGHAKIILSNDFSTKQEINFNSITEFSIYKLKRKNKSKGLFSKGDRTKADTHYRNRFTEADVFGKSLDTVNLPMKHFVVNMCDDYKNIALDMNYGIGKYKDTRIVNINYANIIRNNTKYTFFISAGLKITKLHPYIAKDIHFGKTDEFYIFYCDHYYGFTEVPLIINNLQSNIGNIPSEETSSLTEVDSVSSKADNNIRDFVNFKYYNIDGTTYRVPYSDEYFLRNIGGYVPIDGLSAKFFNLKRNNNTLFNVKIRISNNQRHLEIFPAHEWPIRIINNTNDTVRISQHQHEKYYYVNPHETLDYCYDLLYLKRILEIKYKNEIIKYSFGDEIETYKDFTITSYKKDNVDYYVISNEGCKEIPIVVFEATFSLPITHISVCNLRELLCIHIKGINLKIKNVIERGQSRFIFDANCLGLQIDDQTINTTYPIIFVPRSRKYFMLNIENKNDLFARAYLEIKRNISSTENNTQVSTVNKGEVDMSTVSESKVNAGIPNGIQSEEFGWRILCTTLFIQEFYLRIDEDLIMELLDVFKDEIFNYILQCHRCSRIVCQCLKIQEKRKLNFKVDSLLINPIVLNVSFKKSGKDSGIYSQLIKHISMNISDYKIKFSAELLTEMDCPMESITEIIANHYKAETMKSFLRLILSVDILGNIGSFTDTFSVGLKDLFYESYAGLREDDPKKFTLALVRGSKSLVKQTISGFSGILSKFTNSVSKNMALATFDKDFQAYHYDISSEYINNHMVKVKDTQSLGNSAFRPMSKGYDRMLECMKSTVSGFVDKPYEGAKKGVGGFFKGVGKGVIGLGTKPFIGFIDLMGGMADSIKVGMNSDYVCRLQYPRHFLNVEYNFEQNLAFYVYKKYLRSTVPEFIYGDSNTEGHTILCKGNIFIFKKDSAIEIGVNEVTRVGERMFYYSGGEVVAEKAFLEKLMEEIERVKQSL